jgi:hypothetical protein
MNTKHFIALIALCSAVAAGNLFAENTAKPDKKGKFKELVSKETREKLQAARQEAMKDPNVVALEKQKEYLDQQYRDAVRAAMVKSDPSLQPVLDQMKDMPMRGGRFGKEGRGERKFEGGKRGQHLPPEAKEKLEQIKDDPAVKAAHDKMEAAQTPEEKKAAWAELTAARKAALEKIDPELAQRLEQLHKGKPGR